MRKGLPLWLLVAVSILPRPAAAAESCAHAVVVTFPGVTWADIERESPPNILEVVERGAAGSVSVRTDSSTTSFASGFTTLGAGTRAEGGLGTGGESESSEASDGRLLRSDVRVAGLEESLGLAESSDYHPVPGALGSALGDVPLVAIGNADITGVGGDKIQEGRWTLLAAMDEEGLVDEAATGLDLLENDRSAPFEVRTDPAALQSAVDEALDIPCSSVVIDGGDLVRREQAIAKGQKAPPIREPLLALDELVGKLENELDAKRDLLLLVSPTAPLAAPLLHLGIAAAMGPGFPGGTELTSASTGGPGIVALTDVAPTVLRHVGVERPSSMVGRPWVAEKSSGDRVAAGAELDAEARFAHNTGPLISGVYSVLELILVLAAAWLFRRRRRGGGNAGMHLARLETAALAALSFPVVTYLVTPLRAHDLGLPVLALSIILGTGVVVGLAFIAGRSALQRLLVVCALTFVVISVDLLLGSRLQLTGLWGNDPVLGGRFTGLGNRGFTVLGSSSLLIGAVLVHLKRAGWIPVAIAILFVATILVDGTPGLGSDVGGVLALVPVLGITWLLLTGRKVSTRAVLVALVISAAVLGALLAFDLSRPSDQQTHLARFFEDARGRGVVAVAEAAGRKIRANAGVFTSSAAGFLIPPIFVVYAWLVLRGRESWTALRERHRFLHAGLIGSLLLAVLGFAVNDSGIIVVAIVLAIFAPAALLMLIEQEREGPA